MSLNAEIQEHRNLFIQQNTTPSRKETNQEPEPVMDTRKCHGAENIKVHILELKTSTLEHQLNNLVSKVDALQINMLTRCE